MSRKEVDYERLELIIRDLVAALETAVSHAHRQHEGPQRVSLEGCNKFTCVSAREAIAAAKS